jgi:hypothetical protein
VAYGEESLRRNGININIGENIEWRNGEAKWLAKSA